MKNVVKRIAAALLCTILACASLGCDHLDEPLGKAQATPENAPQATPVQTAEPRDSVPHADVKFADIQYERPDTEALATSIEALFSAIRRGDAPDQLLAAYTNIKSQYEAADSAMALAYLLYAFDVTTPTYESEYALLQSALSALDLSMTEVSIALYESSDEAKALVDDAFGTAYMESVYEGESLNSTNVQQLLESEQALITEYDRLCAGFTIVDGGREWSIDDIYYDETLSTAEFYRLYDMYYAALNVKAGECYRKMLSIRREIASKLGYGSYSAYQYDCYGRDYTVDDAKALHQAVKEYIVPLYLRVLNPAAYTAGTQTGGTADAGNNMLWELLKALFSKDELKTESVNVDLTELSLATYDQETFLNDLGTAANDFSPSLAEALSFMLHNDLYDFSISPKKMAGSFTTYISAYQVPYMFVHWQNDSTSIDTVLHELGHFTNYYRNASVGWSQSDSLDLAEVDSQALQLLMTPYYDALYGEGCGEAAVCSLLINCMYAIISGCMEDEFQQLVYAEADMTLEEINALYLRLANEYGFVELYDYKGTEWVAVSHTFQTPLYYISYATSMVPALELWQIAQTDTARARTTYLKLIDRTPYASFREELNTIGLPDVFEERTIKAIADMLSVHLEAAK